MKIRIQSVKTTVLPILAQIMQDAASRNYPLTDISTEPGTDHIRVEFETGGANEIWVTKFIQDVVEMAAANDRYLEFQYFIPGIDDWAKYED